MSTPASDAPSTSVAAAPVAERPSFERKIFKGRPDVIPTIPFHSLTRASFTKAESTTVQLPLVATLAELSNKSHMEEMVRRLVLFRSPEMIEQKSGSKRNREASSDAEDSEAEGATKTLKNVASRAVVSITRIGTPQSHVQTKGKGGVSSVRFNLPVEVVVATISHGICPGIVREVNPFPGMATVEVECDSKRINVTCVCPESEPAAVGQTVLIAAEPTCLRVQVFRPPRVSRGKFEKKMDVKLGQTELVFVPDVLGDALTRQAAESKAAANSQAVE